MNEKYDLCDIDESYLHTVSMTELFDSAYQSKPRSSTACSTGEHIFSPALRRSARVF